MSNIDFFRQKLSEFSKRAFQRRLVGGTGGNLSVRIPDTDTVLITPTGISLGDVEPEENILVGLEGEVLDSPKGLKGTKEALIDCDLMWGPLPMSTLHMLRLIQTKKNPFHWLQCPPG